MSSRRPASPVSASITRGSVLAIPLRDNSWAIGQVIVPGTNFYLGICLEEMEHHLKAEDILDKRLGLFSWTNDAEVFRGGWQDLGVINNIQEVDFPDYKIYVDGNLLVETFDGSKRRKYDNSSDMNLHFRKVRSPLLVQDAVQAALGYGEWRSSFNEMLPRAQRRSPTTI